MLFPHFPQFSDTILSCGGLEQSWEYRRTFDPGCVEFFRIQTQDLQIRGSNLRRFHKTGDGLGLVNPRVRYQQRHVGFIMSESAMLGLFLGASPP